MAKYRKTAGVYYRHESGGKKMYKRGDIIEATEEELKQTDPTLNSWEPVDPEAAKNEVERLASAAPLVEAAKMTRLKRGAVDKYDVVNKKSKKKLNDTPLTEEEAISITEDTKKEEPKKKK